MTPERYQQICDIFGEAKEISPQKRAGFLDAVCAGDDDLRTEVESMLASDEESGAFFEDSALNMAAGILAGEAARDKIGRDIGHYKIISLLGAGGMGEVWLAEDARLKRRIALKLLSAVQNQDFLIRFEQEAHAASALNHPNIITIFDIGQSENIQFIATEHIDGKTLRRLIKEKSLKIADAVEIAVQICSALVAAHQAGIVHRDIKPENIMVRSDGIVKVLDFGLARFSIKNTSNPDAKYITKPGMIMGTIDYMSPEQARALPIEESTDIFSLGIVLYEMLSGRLPFEGVNEIDTLAAILEREPPPLGDAVPAALKKIVASALIKAPFERPPAETVLYELRAVKRRLEQSGEIINQLTADHSNEAQTVQMTAVTEIKPPLQTGELAGPTAASSPVRRSFSKKSVTLSLILMLAVVSGFALYRFRLSVQPPAVLGEADKLLIAEFENKTGDEEFDNIFRQPLAVGLAQSPFIGLVTDGQIRQTLKAMEKPSDERLTSEIAGEICRRRGVKAFLKGSIENYGVKYLLTLEAFNAETGASVAREQIESSDKETVIDSLDQVTAAMRGKLGESLASIKQFDAPLKTSTTSSLEALKAYSLATKSLSDGNIDEGITFLKQAVDIDPNYGGAYGSLAGAYSNKGQPSVAADYAAKAFALRDRMTEREKQKITSFYYVFVTGELEKDIENLEAAKQSFPRDNTIPLNLSASYVELGKFAKGEENSRLSITLDPTIFFPYSNLGQYLAKQSRFEESNAVFRDTLDRGFESDQITKGLLLNAFALGDEEGRQRQLKILQETNEDDAVELQAEAAAFSGQVRESEKLITKFVNRTGPEMPDTAADAAGRTALNLAALGKCPAAQVWAGRALQLDRGQPILTDAALTSALCGGQTDPLIAELKQKFPKNTVVNTLWLPVIRAALESKDAPDRALESLEINRQFEGATYFWDNYLRGKLYLKLKQPEAAAAEFNKILQNRGWAVYSPLFVLAHLELAKTCRLKNDEENARKYSMLFADLWKNADPDLLSAGKQD